MGFYIRIKNFKYILFLIFISLIFLKPVFSNNFYLSHDGVAHVARFAAYFKAFSDVQIPPRWAADLNSGYGSPLFIFFYPLPGYLASLIHVFGFDFETIFKIIVSLSFILSPIFLFLWLREKAKDEVAFVVSIIYLVLPYRILDALVRGDVAELLSFVFIPLVFLFIDRVQKEGKLEDLILGGIFFSLFILSHNAIAFIFAPIFFLYSFVFSKNKNNLFKSLTIFFLGLLISFFFWFPSIADGKFVYAKLFVESMYKDNFVSVLSLIYSNWGFGTYVNEKGGLSAQIGVLYFLIPFLTIFWFKKIREKKNTIFWLSVFLIGIFLATDYSKIVWEISPFIKLMQFPWRFTALSGFASCMIIFYLFKNLNNRTILWATALLFILTSLPFVKVKGYENKRNDSFYNSYQGTTDYHRRTSTIWSEGDFSRPAKSQVELIGGEAQITNFKKGSTFHTFDVIVSRNSQFLDNTVYFPGWKVRVDGKEVPIEFQDMNHRGLITFRVPVEKHSVSVKFEETKVRFLSDIISAIAMMLALGILFAHGNKLINIKSPK